MKITAPGAELAAAVSWAAALTPAKPPIPVLAALRLDTGGVGLTVSAFDFDTAGTVTVDAEVDVSGTAFVSGRLLAAVTKTLAREKAVTFEVEGERAVVSCGKAARWELPLLDGENYPTLPTAGVAVATVATADLAAALARVLPVLSGEVGPSLRGVAVSADDGPMTLAATDKYRLAVVEIDWQRPEDDDDLTRARLADLAGEVMIPTELFAAAESALTTTGGPERDEVTLHLSGQTAGVSGPRHTVVGRLAGDRAPRWRAMLEGKGFAAAATVRVDALREVVDRAVVVADADAPVAVRLDGDGLGVSVIGAARGAAEHHAAVESWSGVEQSFGANPRYLRAMLDGLRSPLVALELGRSAVKATPTDADGSTVAGYTHVVALQPVGARTEAA